MALKVEEKDRFYEATWSSEGQSMVEVYSFLVEGELEHPHLLLDLTNAPLSEEDKNGVNRIAEALLAANRSCVVVGVGLDWLKAEEVPTMTEARDIIFMEQLERELGDDLEE